MHVKEFHSLWLLHDVTTIARDELGMFMELRNERKMLSSLSSDPTRFVKLMPAEAAFTYLLSQFDHQIRNIFHFPTIAGGSWTAPLG